ncbi:MAG: hypothetical protein ACM3QW_09025, partial [Ignavibacteriales bacterium]
MSDKNNLQDQTQEPMQGPVNFFSRCPNYKILKQATVLNVQNGIPVLQHGSKVEFANNEFSTSDPEIIAFLRGHKAYGLDFIEDKPDEIPAKAGA